MKVTKEVRDEHLARLRELCPPGTTVYTILAHVSRSGMQREIKCYALVDGQMQYLSGYIANVTGYRRGPRDGNVIGGAGMDMGFALVYDLAYTLWGKDFICTGEGCPSNDHSNGDRDYTPHNHSDGGYALKHSWL